ncbi:MAG TPA: hypothetical protein VFU93_01960 [Acidimicrobiales bacterium]|nr:hypothetical protein [Acidimicrobiales bacterium]
MDGERRISERIVFGVLAVALVLGIGIYNVIPLSSSSDEPATPAVIPTTTTVAPDGESGGAAGTGSASFGSGIAALQSQRTADQLVADAAAAETLVPGPSCPADVVTAVADDARGRVEGVLGVEVSGRGLADLAAIAAGCSNADATGPLLSFALELAALTTTAPTTRPATAAPTVATSAPAPAVTVPGAVATTVTPAVPATTVPAAVETVPVGLPAGLADALAPEAAAISAGCADVGFIAVLVAVVPGATVEVYGADADDAAADATALCELFGV